MPATSASAVVAALGQASDRGEPIERILDAVGRLAPIDVCIVIDDVHEVPPQVDRGRSCSAELVVRLPPHAHLVLAGRTAAADPAVRCAVPPARWSRSGSTSWRSPRPRSTPWRRHSAARRHRANWGSADFAGWPSLVRLALSAPEGSAPQFLWEEVVAGLSAEARRLLLALATLGWGTASDVAWVAGSGDGGSDPLVDARLDMIAANVPLVSGDADGWYRVHHLWEEAVERIFSDEDRVGDATAGARVVPAAAGHVAYRLERAAVGRRPRRWVGVPRARARTGRRVADRHGGALAGRRSGVGPRHAGPAPARSRPPPCPRLRRPAPRRRTRRRRRRATWPAATIPGRSSPSSSGWRSPTCGAIWPDFSPSTSGPDRCPALTTSQLLRFLRGAMRAMTASLEGDAVAAVAAIEAMSIGDAPAPINQLVVRLHANMLGLCGRADEAVSVAALLLDSPSPYARTLHAKARWLAGDPTGYPGGQFEAAVPPGTNERYQLHHAMSGMAVATSFGNRKLIDELSSILERWATDRRPRRHDARLRQGCTPRRRPRRGAGGER